MRPNLDPGIKTKNRLGGESIAMGIHQGALQKVMDILTNLYSDPVAAVIREYSTNARDSHIAAGLAPVPIKVTLPTTFSPIFQVQDFGVGLSLDDIREIYSQYGASTKEGNDDETGYLGMGSKSGLTYTDQFTVTAVKDGRKVQAVVARSDDGTASIRVLHDDVTDEGNGVTIKMPVQGNVSLFVSKAEHFFQWWEEGTVELINGNHRPVTGRRITDDILLIEGGTDYVVMGGVGYPVNRNEVNLSEMLPYSESIVVFVPMGSVNFTPSREGLYYTALTKRTLEDYKGKIKANIIKTAEGEVAASDNHTEALITAMKWKNTLRNHKFFYKGREITSATYYSSLKVDVDGAIHYSPDHYGKQKAKECDYLDLRDLKHYVFITGFEGKSLSSSARAKMRKYAADNEVKGTRFVFAKTVPCLPWTEALETISYEDVKAVKLPKGSRGSSAPSPWDVYRNGQGLVKETEIKDTDLVYISPSWLGEAPRRLGSLHIDTIQELLPDNATIVVAAANRWDRLKREYPKVKNALRVIEEHQQKVLDKASEDAKAGVKDEYVFATYSNLANQPIADPDIKAVADAAPRVSAAAAPYKQMISKYQRTARILRAYDESLADLNVDAPLATKAREGIDTYPFIRYTREAGVTHTIEYINALHKEKN